LSTNSLGNVKYDKYNDSTISVDYFVNICRKDELYVDNYIDKNKLIQDADKIEYQERYKANRQNIKVYQKAKKEYLLNHLIPELVSCKVFKVEITDKETGEKSIISNIDELIEKDIYDRNKNKDKNNIPYLFEYNLEYYEITGVRTGKRFEYAVRALKSTYDFDANHEYAPKTI